MKVDTQSRGLATQSNLGSIIQLDVIGTEIGIRSTFHFVVSVNLKCSVSKQVESKSEVVMLKSFWLSE